MLFLVKITNGWLSLRPIVPQMIRVLIQSRSNAQILCTRLWEYLQHRRMFLVSEHFHVEEVNIPHVERVKNTALGSSMRILAFLLMEAFKAPLWFPSVPGMASWGVGRKTLDSSKVAYFHTGFCSTISQCYKLGTNSWLGIVRKIPPTIHLIK